MPSPYVCSACRHRLQSVAWRTALAAPQWPQRRRASRVITPHATLETPTRDDKTEGWISDRIDKKIRLRFQDHNSPIPPHLQQASYELDNTPGHQLPDTAYQTRSSNLIRYRPAVQQSWDKKIRQFEERLLKASGNDHNRQESQRLFEDEDDASVRTSMSKDNSGPEQQLSDSAELDGMGKSQAESLFEEIDDESTRLGSHPEIARWKEMWLMADTRARAHQFPDLMLRYMDQESPFTLTLLLITTSEKPLPSDEMISDVLDISALHATTLLDRSLRPARIARLFQLTCLLLRRYPLQFPISMRTVNALLSLVSPQRQRALINLLMTRKVKLDYEVLDPHAFAAAAEYYGPIDIARSLNLLRRVARTKRRDSARPLVLSALKKCLHSHNAKDLSQISLIISVVRESKIELQLEHYNILLKRLTDGHYFRNTLFTWNELSKAGIGKDAMTYEVMFNWSRRTAHFNMFRTLHRELRTRIDQDPDFHMTERLLSNWLMASLAFESHRHDRHYAQLLKIYSEHADTAPLIELGIYSVSHESLRSIPNVFTDKSRRPKQAKLQPSSQLLGIMIWCWLRAYRYDPQALLDVYSRFRELARTGGNWWAMSSVRSNFVWDAFLYAITWSNQLRFLWSDVWQGMLDPCSTTPVEAGIPPALMEFHGLRMIPADTDDEMLQQVRGFLERQTVQSTKPYPYRRVVPRNIQTWNILLNGFARHNMPDAAQAVFSSMQAEQKTPTATTWNTLIKAWAVAGDRDKVLATVDAAETAGHVLDQFTVRAIQGTGRTGVRVREMLGQRVRGGGVPTDWHRNHDGTYNNPFVEETGQYLSGD